LRKGEIHFSSDGLLPAQADRRGRCKGDAST